MRKYFSIAAISMVALTACNSLKVVSKPLPFDETREQLSLEYLKARHGLEKETPTIIPKMIVIHHTVIPTADKTFSAFAPSHLPQSRKGIKGASALNVSSQYMVDRDGTIYQLLPDTLFARHTIGLNHCAIGVENVGGTSDLPMTEAQLKANVKLVKELTKNHPIEYLIGHHEYQQFIGHELWKETDPNYLTTKSDPGEKFMNGIRDQVRDLNLMGPPPKADATMVSPDHWHGLHTNYIEPTITQRRFKHADIQSLIERVESHQDFKVQKLGNSVEGRSVSLISYGNGPVDVLMWSQMHGNEATATMAIMDIFNYLSDDGVDQDFKKMLKEKLTLQFIPMLNPDGAEKFQRRNALGVDLNRDALRLQNPETIMLKKVRDSLDADWGFNLHDQSRYYAAGLHPKTASISFLAPAYNYEKDVNEIRGRAMQQIGRMNDVLQQYIPGKVAKYNDDFEPRAFGDNIQKWGTSTILIESGGLVDDREKQVLRQLHFVILLSSFQDIMHEKYKETSRQKYEDIPFNDSNMFNELIIRNGTVVRNDKPYILDIAFRLGEVDNDNNTGYYLRGSISDIGDLSTRYGYDVLDATGYEIVPGKTWETPLTTPLVQNEKLSEGYTDFIFPDALGRDTYYDKPWKYVPKGEEVDQSIDIGRNPSLLLVKDGKIDYAIINGFLYKV